MRGGPGILRHLGISIVDRWIDFGVRRPMGMIAVWAVLLLVAGSGLIRLRVETSGESILDRSDERWSFYRKSVDWFGNDEVIVAAVEAREPYDPGSLAHVAEITRSLENAPGVRRVDSISSLPIIEARPDGEIRLDPAFDPDAPADRAHAALVEHKVSED